MGDLDPNLLVAPLSAIVGVVVGALANAWASDWSARQAEERARRHSSEEARRARDLEAIRQTRRRADHVVSQLKAAAITPREWVRRDQQFELANDALIGNPSVIREYGELLIELQRRVGAGLPVTVQRRSAAVMGRVHQALAEQDARVLRGEAPVVIPSDISAELFDLNAFGDRLLSVGRPPTLVGWIARRYLLAMVAWERWRLRDRRKPQ